MNDDQTKKALRLTVIIGPLLLAFGMWGCPTYSVWEREQAGKAELAQAEYSRKVQIEDAKGKFESAKSLAQAEVERAKGVAEANKIIGESLKGHDDYLRYLWISNMKTDGGGKEIIYIPTEANLPITEALRLKK
jgi:regulator of protease activity HflC (stomatin/prohibitin superfamily)